MVAIAAVAAAFIAGGASAAMAQMWQITADLPVSFTFLDDSPDGESISADSVGGYRIGIITPLHIGVGMTRATATVNEYTLNGEDQNFDFNFTDFLIGFNIARVTVTLGYGVGKLTFDPPSSALAGFELSFGEADATQTIIGLGLMLSDNWDVHVGYHAMLAKDVPLKLTFLGSPLLTDKGDLGATMLTAGIGYYF
ncbi:MAG: hypothetical protein HY342_02790 [Candidatus Lambdaproteobacteria bacterium]|nr:hypothetical protein [Candidatus Lambdaproteobacteria bacterium]